MSEYLPQEIIQQIFERLSLKTVIKCTTLSKSWRSLIKSPEFTHTHLRRTLQTNHRNGDQLLLLGQPGFLSLHWENSEFREYSELVNPFRFCSLAHLQVRLSRHNRRFENEPRAPPHVCYVVGTCNGLVCLVGPACLIWNPTIHKILILPGKMVAGGVKYFGFGYDLGSKDYKVLRFMSDPYRGVKGFLRVEVYSLASESWKSLDSGCGMPADFITDVTELNSIIRHVSVNGALHWALERRRKNEDNVIVRFDLGSESFGELTVPESLRREPCYVSKYREQLALIRCKLMGNEPLLSCFFMWVMTDYGVAESWTMLFSVQMQGFTYEPISLRTNGGKVLVKTFSGDVPLLVDLEKNSVREFGIKGRHHFFLDYFVESIVLLGHENAVSY